MQFERYPSIENTYRKKVIQRIIDDPQTKKTEWIVTEKVHGANFSFYIDENDIKIARRTGFIAEDEKFYDGWKILDKYKEKMRKLFDSIVPRPNLVVVYGELYGGRYNHPNVTPEPTAKVVQQGIDYCPFEDFIVFDMRINEYFTDYITVVDICKKHGVPVLEPIFVGSFEEALKISEECNDAQTLVPKIHKLPPIHDNIREGNVIKPRRPLMMFAEGERAYLKDKNDKFSEVKGGKNKTAKVDPRLTPEVQQILDELTGYITEERLNGIISKFGEDIWNKKRSNELFGEFKKDVTEDFEKDHQDLIEKDPKIRWIYSKVSTAMWKLINENRPL